MHSKDPGQTDFLFALLLPTDTSAARLCGLLVDSDRLLESGVLEVFRHNGVATTETWTYYGRRVAGPGMTYNLPVGNSKRKRLRPERPTFDVTRAGTSHTRSMSSAT